MLAGLAAFLARATFPTSALAKWGATKGWVAQILLLKKSLSPRPPGDDENNANAPQGAGAAPPLEHPTLKDVGGLAGTLQELRELVEIPLKRPDVLAKLGLEPTRGVLLVGPPGTGKTLTARSLAEDLGVNYIAIVGPEVMGKYYGEAESRLRGIFEKAKKAAPCLVFIDEIDSLAPDRSKVEGEVEKTPGGHPAGADGWLCPNQRCDRAGGHQPTGSHRPGLTPTGAVRPGSTIPRTRPPGQARDSADSNPSNAAGWGGAGCDRRPRRRLGRCRPQSPVSKKPPTSPCAVRFPTCKAPSPIP